MLRVRVYEDQLEEVERIAFEDPLTGLVNRRKLERLLELQAGQGRFFP